MIDRIELEIEGVSPLLMHNGEMADPLNPMTQELKKVSSKRVKTESDHREMAKLEWHAGIYQQEGVVVVPGVMLDKTIIEAARKSRKGKQVQSGVMVDGDPALEFPDKGKSLTALYESGSYTDRRMVVVQKNRIARTRPKFNVWSLQFSIQFDDELVSRSELVDMVDLAGQTIGIGDYRPRFGRFQRLV